MIYESSIGWQRPAHPDEAEFKARIAASLRLINERDLYERCAEFMPCAQEAS